MTRTPPRAQRWGEFTRARYGRLLAVAARQYRFMTLREFTAQPGSCLWRHDVDLSPQAAVRLARIEHEQSVRCTYLFLLRGTFYNVFEAANVAAVREIASLGHEVGLHFDPVAAGVRSQRGFARALASERDAMEQLLGVRVTSFSLHNPDLSMIRPRGAEYAGMRNAYARSIAAASDYCSDSNGYWRYESLADFLGRPHRAIHVLTHPGWWTPTALAPRERIVRCVEGRARATLRAYDDLLRGAGRRNLRR